LNEQKKYDVSDFVKQYDIFFLSEIWIREKSDFTLQVKGYKAFVVPRQNQSRLGRPAGGVALLIKEDIMKYVKKVYTDKPEMIFLLLSGPLLRLEKDILMCFAYIPPEHSTYYNNFNEKNGIQLLESTLLDVMSTHRDTHILVAGDLNSRTGNLQDFITNDNVRFTNFDDFYPADGFDTKRSSLDTETNTFGETLLDLCCAMSIHMLNGRYDDQNGEFTCLPSVGKSVVDYILMDSELHGNVKHFSIIPKTESDHLPVSCTLRGAHYDTVQDCDNKWTRYKWKEEKRDAYIARIHDNTGGNLICEIDTCLKQGNVDSAIEKMKNLLTYAGEQMRVKPYTRKQPQWWDMDCDNMKHLKYRLLNKFRQTRLDTDLLKYKQARTEFKQLCDNKSRLFKAKECDKLVEEGNNPRNMWKCMKNLTRTKQTAGNISAHDWYEHFEKLTNGQQAAIDPQFKQQIIGYMEHHDSSCGACADKEEHHDYLSKAIGLEEVKTALQSMKSGKAPGPDGLVVEFYKNLPHDIILPLLCELFNVILKTGYFPDSWCQAIIYPLYKGKGSVQDQNNYRGISLLNVVGKTFTKIMNKRFVNWTEDHGLLIPEQIGYRKGFRTTDHIFALQAVAQKYLSKKGGRLYILYIDFSKAFDCIQHDILWYVLLNSGVHGPFINVIRNMYSKLSSCVKTAMDGLSSFFKCKLGTRQGCMISPSIFVQFLNEYVKCLNVGGCEGVFISEELPNLLALMYADDIGNMTDTVGRLQSMLNNLAIFCSKFGMSVNTRKTQIMVFRNGGPLRDNEKWWYKGEPVKVTSYYDYLGLTISSRMVWTKAIDNLCRKALKAINYIQQFARCYNCTNVHILFTLFDRMVLPIVLYGSEIWGTECRASVERIQTRFCKFVLGVPSHTSDVAVLGECGRFPLYVRYYYNVICFWVRILNMDDDTITKKCYWMLKRLDENKRYNWVTDVKGLLCRYGFTYVWYCQEIGDPEAFLYSFKQRLHDCAFQDWCADVSDSPKLTCYASLKTTLCLEKYLTVIPHKHLRRAMTQFRCSVHPLAIETGRHQNISREHRTCIHCKTSIEDELHLFVCPLYADIREKYIPCITCYNYFTMSLIFNNENTDALICLSKYLYHCFKKRNAMNVD